MRFVNIFLLFLLVLVVQSKRIQEVPSDGQREIYQGAKVKPKISSFRSNVLQKPLTEYDKCKMECRKLRDMVEMEEYIQQLREELHQAETKVKEDDEAFEKELADQEEDKDGRISRMAKAAKRMMHTAKHNVKMVADGFTGEKEESRSGASYRQK